jgi:serine/threonine protein kinase
MITDFEISECNIKDLIKSCSIKTKDNKVYVIADRVYNKQKICDEWIIYDTIGEPSGVGKIFEADCAAKRDKSKKYIMKLIHKDDTTSEKDFHKEVFSEIEMQNYVYDKTGFTTPIYQVFTSKDKIMFVTDRLDTTLFRFLFNELIKEQPDIQKIQKLFRECIYMIHTLYENNIAHNDAHLNNFMLDKHGKLYIIDFGKTRKIGKKGNKNELLIHEYEFIAISLYKLYNRIDPRNRYIINELLLEEFDLTLVDLLDDLLENYDELTIDEKQFLRFMSRTNPLTNVEIIKSIKSKKAKKLTINGLDKLVIELRKKSSIFYHAKQFFIAEYIAMLLEKII